LGSGPLQRLAVEALQARIDGLIRQLDHFGEGQSWCDPDALLNKSPGVEPPENFRAALLPDKPS